MLAWKYLNSSYLDFDLRYCVATSKPQVQCVNSNSLVFKHIFQIMIYHRIIEKRIEIDWQCASTSEWVFYIQVHRTCALWYCVFITESRSCEQWLSGLGRQFCGKVVHHHDGFWTWSWMTWDTRQELKIIGYLFVAFFLHFLKLCKRMVKHV